MNTHYYSNDLKQFDTSINTPTGESSYAILIQSKKKTLKINKGSINSSSKLMGIPIIIDITA